MNQQNHPTSPPVGDAGRGSWRVAIPAANPPVRPPGVLVVDDDDGVRRVVAAGLRHHGFAVWLAAGGREAVDHYRRHGGAIDVALLDVQMPGRDGPGTLADLRAFDPNVRACFMTGDAGRYTDQVLVGLGALAVFRKPLHLGRLAARLDGLRGETPGH